MIVKKVGNPRKSSSTAVRITRLADYIDAPEHQAVVPQKRLPQVKRV